MQTKWLVDIGAGPYGGTHVTGGKTIATVKSYGVDARPTKVSPEEAANQQRPKEAAATVQPSATEAPRKSVSRKTITNGQHGGKSIKLMTDLGFFNNDSDSEDTNNDECAVEDTDDESLAEETTDETDDEDEAKVEHHVKSSPRPSGSPEDFIEQYLKTNPAYFMKLISNAIGNKTDVLTLKSPVEVRHKRARPVSTSKCSVEPESEADRDAESIYESSSDEVDSEDDDDSEYANDKGRKTLPNFARKGLPSTASKKPAQKKPTPKTFKSAAKKPVSTTPRSKPVPKINKSTGNTRPSNNDDLVALIKPDVKLMNSIDHSQSNPAQTVRQHVPYPAPNRLLAASEEMYWRNLEAANEKVLARRASNTSGEDDSGQEASVTIPWTIFEDELVIGHMLDIRIDPAVPETEARFAEVSKRLEEVNNIHRTKTSIKNMWNRVGRARSGFDERRRQGGPAATSMQGNMIKKIAKEENYPKKVAQTGFAGSKRKWDEVDSDEYEEGEVRDIEADTRAPHLSASDRAFMLGVRDRKKNKKNKVYRCPDQY